MKIIFSNPPSKNRKGLKERGMFPLPAIMLADALGEEMRIEQASPDLTPNHLPLVNAISDSKASWAAFTCYQETMSSVIELARLAKNTGKKVVLGGAHVCLWGGKVVLEEIPEADFVIIGEGELPFKMLIEGFDFNKIPGLWWRDNGKIKNNNLPLYYHDWINQPPLIKGYLHFDYSEIWDLHQRNGRTGHKKPFSVMAIRGCAYALRNKKRCKFCAMPLGNLLRCRLPRHFWAEIMWAVDKYGIDVVWDHSDSLFGSVDWLNEAARTRPIGSPSIWCYGRADEIRNDTIQAISKIGVEHIYIGVEVGSNQRLREFNKGITLEEVSLATHLCKKYDIKVQLSFIFGLPGETRKSLDDILKLAAHYAELGVEDIVFHEFILRKGLGWFNSVVQKYPGTNGVVIDQGELQEVYWKLFNPSLDRDETVEKVKSVISLFPKSELTAWNI